MSAADFRKLADLFPDEAVTHSSVQDIDLPARDGQASPGILALITLDNGLGPSKPTTLGPNTLVELGTVLEVLRERAAAGEIAAVGVTGKPNFFVAGADLSAVTSLREREHGLWMAQLGHEVYATLANLGVPSFAFINGVAFGGGLEIALHSTYRTVSAGAGALALPEAFLGLVPGWGGVYLLPRLIGPENAVKVMIENALNNNRTLSGSEAFQLGIADALFEPEDFLEQSLAWAARVLSGTAQERPAAVDPADPAVAARWADAVAAGRAFVETKTSNASPAPAEVLNLMSANRTMTQAESAALECETLAGLMQTDEFRATVYAFLDLVQKRAKRPAGAPARELARPVTKIGVVGAGLMASQLALLFARQLGVPVVLTDIDQDRVDKGVSYVHNEVDKLAARIPFTYPSNVPGLPTHNRDHFIELVNRGSFQDSFWRCRDCRRPLYRNPREGLGFRRCECSPKKGKRGVLLEDSRVHYSQTLDLVDIEPKALDRWKEHPRFSDVLLAAILRVPAYNRHHLLDLAAWKPMEVGRLSPELQHMKATLIKDLGLTDEQADTMVRKSAQQGRLNPWARLR